MVQTFSASAGEWFVRSGIQGPNGGVARYYRSDVRENALVSTEITGYAVSALADFFRRTGNEEFRDGALRAARFLTDAAWDMHLKTFPFEHSENGAKPQALAYFFDCGIIVRGLLAAWRLSGDEHFLQAAVHGGTCMLADFASSEAIHPIVTLPAKQPLEYGKKWSARPGCYQLKSALAWHELETATGKLKFGEAYERALEQAICSAEEFLPGDEGRERTMDRLHAFAYFLEGMLPAVNRPKCAQVYATGIARMEECLRELEESFVRSDVYAQLLRARLYGGALGAGAVDERAAEREAEKMMEFQSNSADAREAGGFGFGRKLGVALPFVNPVSTAFCAQALAQWEDYQMGLFTADVEALV